MTGECEYPVAADGITLNIGSELLTTYFANSLYNNGSLYQCSKFYFQQIINFEEKYAIILLILCLLVGNFVIC